MRKVFYSCSLLFLCAALVFALLDCAKSVAFSALNFTFMSNFLEKLSGDFIITLQSGKVIAQIFYQCLYYIPVWFFFFILSWFCYYLGRISPHLWKYWRKKFQETSLFGKSKAEKRCRKQ